MNAIVYHSIPGKLINGTLFYSFEYYAFLRQYTPTTYYIVGANEQQLAEIKRIFREKYTVTECVYDDVRIISRTDFAQIKHQCLIMLDVQTMTYMSGFSFNCDKVVAFSSQEHSMLGKPRHVFFGWYDYQPCTIRNRLKFYGDIHRRFETRGSKTFISHLNGDGSHIVSQLGLSPADVLVKSLNTHNNNLFEQINKVVYYHTGFIDTNNRIIVESYIQGIPVEAVLNGHTHDSVADRVELLASGGLGEVMLDENDPLIQQVLQ